MQAVTQAASAAAQAAVQATHSSRAHQLGTPTTPVQLPKLSLPTFAGGLLAWPDFWDMFSASVDTQPLPQVSKFTYLKSVLRGAASRLIAGLAVTDQNYTVAVQMLKDEFGKPDILIGKL